MQRTTISAIISLETSEIFLYQNDSDAFMYFSQNLLFIISYRKRKTAMVNDENEQKKKKRKKIKDI